MKAGSLEIEILTNLARVQSDMMQMKRIVGGGIDGVNDSLSKGASNYDRYVTNLSAQSNRAGAAMGRVTASAGAQRAGMQQLSFQLGDSITQWAGGTKMMTIFAQQAGQTAMAVGLMTGQSKGLIGLIGGPWGQVLIAGATIVGVLASSLMGSKEAAEKAAKAMKEFQDRQSDIKNFIDDTTGALKEQNKTLVLNAVLTRQAQMTANAKEISDSRRKAFDAARSASFRATNAAPGTTTSGVSFTDDPDVQRAIQASQGNVDKLAQSIARLAQTSRPDLAKVALSITSIGGQAILAARENEKLSRELRALGGDTHALAGSTTALIERQVAAATATSATEKAQARLNDVRAKAQGIDALAAGAAKDRALAQYRADLQAAVLAERAAKASDGADKKATAAATAAQNRAEASARAAAKAEATHAEALARDSNAISAAVKGLWDLADAYEQGGAAAMRAEALATANEKAVRKEGDAALMYREELARLVAQQGQAAGRQIADLKADTAAQQDANEMVAQGLVTSAQAIEFMRKEAALRAIAAAMENAQGKALEDLHNKYDLLAAAIDDNNRKRKEAAAIGDTEQNNQQTERLQKELELIGATNRERAVALAQLEVEAKYNRGKGMDEGAYAALLKSARDRAVAEDDLAEASELHNRHLHEQLDILDQLDQRAHSLADSLSDAFGRPGQALGDMITEFTGFAARQEALQNHLAEIGEQYGLSSATYAIEEQRTRAQMATNEIGHYGDLLGAARGLFKENSTGYKAVTALEKVYSAIRLANMIKSMVLDKVSTASSVGNSMVRGTADAAAGAAKIFSFLGPFAFPVVAAMVALLASLGLKGLHGGGNGPSIPTAEDIQKAQGTGTVLGDSSAKSDSIAKALDLVAKNSNKNLEYSNEMVRSLRAIESNIGGLSTLIARQMGVSGGMFDTSSLGLGKSSGIDTAKMIGAGAFLFGPIGLIGAGLAAVAKDIPVIGGAINTVVKALFGTSKTVTLLDQGLNFAAQSVQDIISGGIDGLSYQTVQTTKKSKFFGISTGAKTKVSDQTAGLGDSMEQQITLLVASLRDGVVAGAKAIGIDGAEAMADAFQVDLGRISFKDLTGDEIEKALQAEFSKVADDMAAAVVGGLSAFQKVGEGLFETLARLARDYQVLDVSLQSIGMTFGAVGAGSVGARENLIDLVGGIDAFAEKTNFIRENFLSEAEQMAPILAAVSAEMNRLGLASVDTKDEFKQALLGIDLTTEGGQQLYAALLDVAPAFLKASDYLAKLNGTVAEVAQTAEQLAAIEKQRRSLDIALMDAQGRSEEALAAKRADELAALDPTLRALQEQVWAAQDAAAAQKDLADAQDAAAKSAEALAAKRRDLDIQLMEATGDAAGALAAKRADELAAMDESLRALQQQVWAAQDAAESNQALADVHATAAEIAKQQRDLEIQLMDAQGNAAGALAARRADELAAIDPVLRALQQQVWAAQDAAEANQALADVQQTAAEIARTRRELEIQLMQAEGNAAGALAAKRQDELAALDPSLRALQQQVWAAQDAAEANQALADVHSTAAELAKQQRDLEIRLMEAQGDAAAVLAARRADELAATDPLLQALLQQIYTAEDAATAAQALADAQQAEAQAARTRRDLEIRLMEAQGDAAGALAAKREDELAAADATVRALLQQIYAAEDAATANQALADAQAAAAQAAEQAAQQAAELAKARSGLEIDLMRALGHEAEAVAAERALQLAATDDSLKGLQQQVWAAQDATAAQQALADAQAEAAKAAEEAAAAQQALADKRTDLEIRLLRATGNEIGAVAMERQRELEQLDPSLRALMLSIYAAEDAKAATDDQSKALDDVRSKFLDLGNSLRDFRVSLAGTAAMTADQAYRAASAQFGAVNARARQGDADAIGSLQSAAQSFLEASKANAGSRLEFLHDVGAVASAVGDAIAIADAKVSDADRQLAALELNTDWLTVINGSVVSVHDAILAAADRGAPIVVPSSAYVSTPTAEGEDVHEIRDEVRRLADRIGPPIEAIAVRSAKIDDRQSRWDNAGSLAVSTRDGDSIEVTP